MPTLTCDGCGQPASPEHIARRLQRLEWSTRYRPIHMQTLLLGAAPPAEDEEFLYSPHDAHAGEAQAVLAAAGIETAGKSADAVHSEFQRRGLYLSHVLECPLAAESSEGRRADLKEQLSSRLPAVFTRIRRSLKPRRLILISGELEPFTAEFAAAQLNCELTLDEGAPFTLDSGDRSVASGPVSKLQRLLQETVPR